MSDDSVSDDSVSGETTRDEAVPAVETRAPGDGTEVEDTGGGGDGHSPPSLQDRRHNGRKVREGVVSSTSMDKTVIVSVVSRVRHPLYRKTLQHTTKLYAHDAEGTCRVGDRVRVTETRPMSKLKRWRLLEVLERAR